MSAFKKLDYRDSRSLPAYTLGEASHYLLIPSATLRSWIAGRPYPTKQGSRFFRPVFQLPSPRPILSFVNLIEAHVLDAIRRQHQIPLDKIRIAVDYLQKYFKTDHPLASQDFETDGVDLFVTKFDQLINVSRVGQTAMREILQAHLCRIERDAAGIAVRLYPFTRKRGFDEPKSVVIDPMISFGRPVLAGTGIPTAIIAERYKAGDGIDSLASDYERPRLEIEEAIRCELALDAA
jgi:uncharacterized protein (DUF433 family)